MIWTGRPWVTWYGMTLQEKNDIYENPINEGLIWNLFWYMSSREILRDMYLQGWGNSNM